MSTPMPEYIYFTPRAARVLKKAPRPADTSCFLEFTCAIILNFVCSLERIYNTLIFSAHTQAQNKMYMYDNSIVQKNAARWVWTSHSHYIYTSFRETRLEYNLFYCTRHTHNANHKERTHQLRINIYNKYCSIAPVSAPESTKAPLNSNVEQIYIWIRRGAVSPKNEWESNILRRVA
jgi:hypothetical protein